MVDRYQQQQAHSYAYQAGAESDDDGLGVEYARDVLLGRSDSTKYSDLLGTLQHGDVCDDSDHDRGYDQGYRHEGYEHVADRVGDLLDGVDEHSGDIRITDDLVFFAGLLHVIVVVVDELQEGFLRIEIL